MAKEKFLMVSLKEGKSKKIAQVISNETSRKILDYLSDKDASESELAEKLKVPISTVHYNMKHLMDAKLVIVDEFHYSEKGKEVNHYKLANKYIIIAPGSTWGLKEKLKNVLPALLGVAVISGIVQGFTKYLGFGAVKSTAVMKTAPETFGAVQEGARAAAEAVPEAADAVPEAVTAAQDAAQEPVQQIMITEPAAANIALWILIGGIIAIGLYLLWDYIREKRNN